jgi:hypothetical protein
MWLTTHPNLTCVLQIPTQTLTHPILSHRKPPPTMSKRIDRPRVDPAAQPPLPAPLESTPQQESHLVPSPRNKRRVSGPTTSPTVPAPPVAPVTSVASAAPIAATAAPSSSMAEQDTQSSPVQPPAKKSRTNTPWTAAEEQRLKTMREAGNSWAEIAKV